MAESPGFTGLGARSFPGFPVSPRSVHPFAAVAAGAYPLRRPPNAWSLGAPAPPGPCYWLVASGTPLGWRGGCLAWGWGVALCATTALAGAVPRLCVRGARCRCGGFRPVPGVVSLSFPPSRPACSALRVAGRPVRVSLTLARRYAIPRGLCVPRARSGCPSGSPRAPFTCVCARAPAASAPPPPGWCGVRTSRGPGTGCW